jgi:hypothetical protein
MIIIQNEEQWIIAWSLVTSMDYDPKIPNYQRYDE